jgi:hypothetical protein
MTHPWREHIKLTKEKNPTINNFGDIIKLAKQTYTKTSNKKTQKKCNSNKNIKKTLKGGKTQLEGSGKTECEKSLKMKDLENEQKNGGGQIMADKLDMKRASRRYRSIKEGPCIFPFKYNNKTYNECANSKDGRWCATELKDVKPKAGNNISKWGYCETHYLKEDSKKEEQHISSSDSSKILSSDDIDDGNIVSELIEYGEEKYLLETKTRNVYSLSIEIKKQLIEDGVIPEEDFGDIDEKSPLYYEYKFIGRMLPNGSIFYLEDGAEEYEPNKTKIKEKSDDSVSSGKKTSGGGKYGIYNKEVSIIEKYGDIYKVKDSNGNFILTYKNNIM